MCSMGARCTQCGLHFPHNVVGNLQIFSLFLECNFHLEQIWQFIIFILQNVRLLSSSQLGSSTEGKIDDRIFVFMLKLTSSNLPENLQGAPFKRCSCNHS